MASVTKRDRSHSITISLMRVGAGVLLLIGWCVALRQALPIATAQTGIVAGRIDGATSVSVRQFEDTPAGVFDGTNPSRVPGVLPLQAAPAEVDAKVRALADTHDRVSQDAPRTFSLKIAVPPDDPDAPPRMDSGDPNPDRPSNAARRGLQMGAGR